MQKFLISPEWVVFPTNGKVASIKGWNRLKKSVSLGLNNSYGILCGPCSGIAVVDVDTEKGADRFRGDLNRFKYGYMEVKTRRGSHFYFRSKDMHYDMPNGNYKTVGYGPLDIRNNEKGYVIGPGSVVSGHTYYVKNYTGFLSDFNDIKHLFVDLDRCSSYDYDPCDEGYILQEKSAIEYSGDNIKSLDDYLTLNFISNNNLTDKYIKSFRYYIVKKIGFCIGEGRRNRTLFNIAVCIVNKYPRLILYLNGLLHFLNDILFVKSLAIYEVKSIYKYVWQAMVLKDKNKKGSVVSKIRSKLTEIFRSVFVLKLSCVDVYVPELAVAPTFTVEDFIDHTQNE